MPQVFQVVCCYQCSTYQVKQQTKSTQWTCKLCGEKQSLKKVIFEGSAKECRENSQKLNLMKGEGICRAALGMNNTDESANLQTRSQSEDHAQHQTSTKAYQNSAAPTTGGSRWAEFLD